MHKGVVGKGAIYVKHMFKWFVTNSNANIKTASVLSTIRIKNLSHFQILVTVFSIYRFSVLYGRIWSSEYTISI